MRIKVPTSKKKIAGYLATAALIVSACRVLTLFLESLAIVRDERQQDDELIALCKVGQARSSHKMRAACLQAVSDRASPVILKAFMKSLSTSWTGFLDQVSTKSGIVVVILFILSSFIPVTSMLQRLVMLFQTATFEDDDVDEDVESRHSVIVLNGGAPKMETRGMKRRIRRMIAGPPIRARSEIVEIPSDGYEDVTF